jgi:UDP-N-acetylglucosamine diphosphorylase / glucose-1-phosphate thymidylyltransferase / UDP-N-acetylgalactosamine diphosphorylase / glucosamine-1-phosphate N-acetyltransferase / galactosamine-1-phosphate N-acetyltransferase
MSGCLSHGTSADRTKHQSTCRLTVFSILKKTMKAIILAAAKSRKLAPFSDTRPKSMISISGQYILETILRHLKTAGIQEAWIVVNHQKEIIQDYFKYGKSIGLKIEYIEQPEEGGIGQAVSLCEDVVGNDPHFMLVYGDVLKAGNHFEHLLGRFERMQPGALATIAHPLSDGDYGNVYLSHDMQISKILEKPEGTRMSNYILGGSFILGRDCFDFLSRNNLDMVAYYQHLISENKMSASLWEDSWIDISRPWHILAANQMAMKPWNTSVIPDTVSIDPNVNIKGIVHFGENVHICSGTTIVGPCYIGSNVFIGNNSLIRKNSSIGPNCKIGYGTEIKNAVLFGNSTVGRLSFIGDSVLGENVQLGSGSMTVNHDSLGKAIIYQPPGEESVNSNLPKLGAFIGDNSVIGTGHTIAPGAYIAANTKISDRITISNSTVS